MNFYELHQQSIILEFASALYLKQNNKQINKLHFRRKGVEMTGLNTISCSTNEKITFLIICLPIKLF